MVTRLFIGPQPDLEVHGGMNNRTLLYVNAFIYLALLFPTVYKYSGSFGNQIPLIKHAYRMVNLFNFL